MSRLTEKNKFDTHYGISISKNLLQSAYDKLGKLEDLEDELGCPLDVLEKAMQNGIYTNVYNGLCMVSRYKDTLVVSDDYAVYIKDYKKTWWLKKDRSE